jgi:hypothetical protein
MKAQEPRYGGGKSPMKAQELWNAAGGTPKLLLFSSTLFSIFFCHPHSADLLLHSSIRHAEKTGSSP